MTDVHPMVTALENDPALDETRVVGRMIAELHICRVISADRNAGLKTHLRTNGFSRSEIADFFDIAVTIYFELKKAGVLALVNGRR